MGRPGVVRRGWARLLRVCSRPLALFGTDAEQALLIRSLELSGVTVEGRPAYVDRRAFVDDFASGLVTLRGGCVVSLDVKLLAHDFSVDRVLRARGEASRLDAVVTDPVVIGEFAFIGAGAIVMPGVTVGRGSIVGAGSVVTKDVPPMTVVAGNPAREHGSADEYLDRVRARHPGALRAKADGD